MFIPSKSTVGNGNEQKKATSNVTKWVFDRLATVDPLFTTTKYQAMASEIQCNEPDCVPIETLIIIMLMSDPIEVDGIKPKKQRWADKILKPILEVTVNDVHQIVDIMLGDYTSEDISVPVPILIDQVKTESVNADESLKVLQPAAATTFLEVTRVKMQPNHPVLSQKGNPVITAAENVQESNFPVPIPPLVRTPAQSSTSFSAEPAQTPSTGTNAKTMENVTMVSTAPAKPSSVAVVADVPVPAAPGLPVVTVTGTSSSSLAPRHKKGGTRPRGCPCCDPDNLDNILDAMMFSHYPQT